MKAMGVRVRRSGRMVATSGAAAMAIVLGSFAFSSASPAAPVVTSPTEGSVQPGLVRVKGTAAFGDQVEVFDGAKSLGTTGVTNGAWTKSVPLQAGSHTVTAIAHSSATVSPPSGAVAFTVDTAKPTISIAKPDVHGVVVPGQAIKVTGSATDNLRMFAVKLEYWMAGKVQLRALADCTCDQAASDWTHTPNLAPGYYTVYAYAVDRAANTSLAAKRDFFVASPSGVGVPAPLQPILGTPSILQPGSGSIIGGAGKPVPVSGKGPPGSGVKLTEQTLGPLGVARTDGRGYWQTELWLPSGTFKVTAQAFDSRGHLSDPSKILTFSVDGDRPVLGFLTSNDAVFLPLQPVLLSGRLADDRRVSAVRVDYWYLGKLVARDRAACSGCGTTSATWSDAPSLPYPGSYDVVAVAYDSASNQSWSRTISIYKLS